MNLFILRHGETEWNIEKRLQGQLDSQLTENGKKQIEKAGEILSNIKFSGIYTSKLGRAINSTKIILEKNKFFKNEKIQKIEEFNEIFFGKWQGMTHEEILEKYPENGYNYFNNIDKYNHLLNNGENLADGLKRFLFGLKKIVEENKKGENILIVTHGTVIELFLNYVENKKFDELSIIKNGEFEIFKVNDGKYVKIKKEMFLK